MNVQQLVPPLASGARNAQQLVPPLVDQGGAAIEFTLHPTTSSSSSGDPNGIDAGSVADAKTGYIQFNIDTPGTARLPSATDIGGTYFEWALATSWSPSDIASALAYVLEDTPPTDTYVAIALTAGGVATIGNGGVLVGLEYNAGGWRCFTMLNAGAGAGWITKTNATAADALTRGVQLMLAQGNASANTRTHAVALEAGGRPSTTSATVPAPQSGNGAADGAFTHIALVCGWSGVAGAATARITASLRSFVLQVKDTTNGAQLVIVPPPSVTLPLAPGSVRIAINGDSNGNATQIDASFGGVAIATSHPGFTFRDAGANLANWPATTTPGTGMVPYLLTDLIAGGATGGWVARRATNGGTLAWAGTIHDNVANLIADAAALGGGDPHVLIFVIGANDGQDAVESAAALDNLRRACENHRAAWPDTLFLFVLEESLAGAGGSYPYLRDTEPSIRTALATIATEFGGAVIDPGLGLPHADDIHFSGNGLGSGQDSVAAAVAAYLT